MAIKRAAGEPRVEINDDPAAAIVFLGVVVRATSILNGHNQEIRVRIGGDGRGRFRCRVSGIQDGTRTATVIRRRAVGGEVLDQIGLVHHRLAFDQGKGIAAARHGQDIEVAVRVSGNDARIRGRAERHARKGVVVVVGRARAGNVKQMARIGFIDEVDRDGEGLAVLLGAAVATAAAIVVAAKGGDADRCRTWRDCEIRWRRALGRIPESRFGRDQVELGTAGGQCRVDRNAKRDVGVLDTRGRRRNDDQAALGAVERDGCPTSGSTIGEDIVEMLDPATERRRRDVERTVTQ